MKRRLRCFWRVPLDVLPSLGMLKVPLVDNDILSSLRLTCPHLVDACFDDLTGISVDCSGREVPSYRVAYQDRPQRLVSAYIPQL